MAKTKTEKKPTVLRVFIIEDSLMGKPCLKIAADVLIYENGDWRGPSDYAEEGELYLHRLRSESDCWSDMPQCGIKGVSFGEPEFEGPMGLWRIEKAIKTLRFLHKRMEDMRQKLGPAETIGAYLARIASAVGAERIHLMNPNGRDDVTGEKYRNMSPGDAVYSINGRVNEWQKNHFPAESVAA